MPKSIIKTHEITARGMPLCSWKLYQGQLGMERLPKVQELYGADHSQFDAHKAAMIRKALTGERWERE